MIKTTAQITLVISLIFISLTKGKHTIPKEENAQTAPSKNNPPFKSFLGINAFEWDFLTENNAQSDPQKVKIMKSFGGFRHYLDWERIESDKDKFTFNYTHSGGFNYDQVYQICVNNNIDILTCLKNCPPWLMNTYPKDQREVDNVPAVYGLSRSDPASYIDQAKAAFQFAARYGNNKKIDSALIRIDKMQRWNGDVSNNVKIGLGYVHYIECDNERDKTWKGAKGHQSPEEYAADLSAFYDGNKGKMGKNVGVKNADPTMKVVMAGLAFPEPGYVIKMISWCRKHRGYRPDGSVNLCFDVINYHYYNSDALAEHDRRTSGRAPELSSAGKVADEFVNMSKQYANNTEVWITESGYDINPKSPQRAFAIGTKSALITQADWMLRSSFLYARHGLKKAFYYMLEDVNVKDPIQYASSGFQAGNKPRPVADYFKQTKQLLGAYSYLKTIRTNPMIDVYQNGNKKMYVLYVPDQVGKKMTCDLDLQGAKSAIIHLLNPGAAQMKTETAIAKAGHIKLSLTETPIFVEKAD